MGSLARVPAAQDQLWAKDPHYWGQKEMNLTVCPGAFTTQPGRANKPVQEGTEQGELGLGGWGFQGNPGTLTAVGLIGVVLTVRVAVTAPQLEDTVPICTGELVGLTGRSGA